MDEDDLEGFWRAY